jgi:hypothetical protein
MKWQEGGEKKVSNSSPNIVKMIDIRAEHGARIKKTNVYKILVWKPEQKTSLEDLDVDGREVLNGS